MDYKTTTIQKHNIANTDGYFRYINHVGGLATTGFKTKEKLISYSDCIRFDSGTLAIMRARYNELYRDKP